MKYLKYLLLYKNIFYIKIYILKFYIKIHFIKFYIKIYFIKITSIFFVVILLNPSILLTYDEAVDF